MVPLNETRSIWVVTAAIAVKSLGDSRLNEGAYHTTEVSHPASVRQNQEQEQGQEWKRGVGQESLVIYHL